ncbi:hypothetical protein [Cupriavidus necator]|uniref:hypothetical protein n=1 Tax=Cupriavidus necator TaxID=106590 RepID=UPI0012D2A219|nr:hypothetical protein [Cupriavidus necator]
MPALIRIQRNHLHKRLAGFCNDERLALSGGIAQVEKMPLGLINIDVLHGLDALGKVPLVRRK